MRSKHLVGLILAATLMATLIPFSTVVYAQSSEEKRAEKFIDTAKQAMQKVDELKAIVNGSGIEIPTNITDLYEYGVTNLTDAEAAKNETDYNSAIELAKEAMTIFREVYEQLNALLEEEEAKAGVKTAESGDESSDGIEQAQLRWDKVSGIIDEHWAGGEGYLTKEAHDQLIEWMDAAESALEDENLGEANKYISQAFVSLKKHVSGALNSGRMIGFLNVISKFYDRVVRLVERAKRQNLIDDERYTTLTTELLPLIDEKIGNAGDEDTPFEDAISYLIDARLQLESIQKDILELRKGGPED